MELTLYNQQRCRKVYLITAQPTSKSMSPLRKMMMLLDGKY